MKPGMSVRLKVFMVIAVTLIVTWTSVAQAANRRWIVMYLEGTNLGAQELLFKLAGIKVLHTLSFIHALAVQLPLGGTLEDLLAFLQGNPAVVGVFDDTIGVLDSIGSFTSQEAPQEEIYDWAQVRIGTPVVHQNMPEWQGRGVKIAILDTGVDANHTDLEQNVFRVYTTRAEESPSDDNGHGTHIAGIIAALANGQGVVGVAPQASLVSIKVLDQNGEGYLSDFIEALELVLNNGIKLVNVSMGFVNDSPPLRKAIKHLHKSGTIIVAAAGNRSSSDGGSEEGGDSDGEGATSSCDTSTNGGGSEEGGDSDGEGASACSDNVKYPARYQEVIAVAATDVYDQITEYSLAGRAVDMAAPGGARANERILSAKRGGGYCLASGTSQATAFVTGSLALALQRKPGLTFAAARDLLRNTAFELPCCTAEQQGAGLIEVGKMMERLQ